MRLQFAEIQLVLEVLHPSSLPWLLAGDLDFLPHEHLHRTTYNMADGFPRRKREGGRTSPRQKFQTLIPLSCTCHFLRVLYQTNLVQCGKEVLHRSMNMKKWNCWGPSWRQATTSFKYSLKQCEYMKVSIWGGRREEL